MFSNPKPKKPNKQQLHVFLELLKKERKRRLNFVFIYVNFTCAIQDIFHCVLMSN